MGCEMARAPRETPEGGPLASLRARRRAAGLWRQPPRLAELLFGREHAAEAYLEVEKIPENLLSDPSLRYLRARILEAKGETPAAEAVLEDPKAWIASFGPCWAFRARLWKGRGDLAGAGASLDEALAHDPFTIETACQDLRPGISGGALCDAARTRDEPDLGRD